MRATYNILRRTKTVVGHDRLADIRLTADVSSTFCVFASLHASYLLGSLPPKLSELEMQHDRIFFGHEKGVSTADFFKVLNLFQKQTGLQIKKVYSNPSFLNHFEIDEAIFDKLVSVTGTQVVSKPNMRILAKKTEDSWITHAESDLGTKITRARISELEENGWSSAMIIEFAIG